MRYIRKEKEREREREEREGIEIKCFLYYCIITN